MRRVTKPLKKLKSRTLVRYSYLTSFVYPQRVIMSGSIELNCDACKINPISHEICAKCFLEFVKSPDVTSDAKETETDTAPLSWRVKKIENIEIKQQKIDYAKRTCILTGCTKDAEEGFDCCTPQHKSQYQTILDREMLYTTNRQCALPGCEATATFGGKCCSIRHGHAYKKLLTKEMENIKKWCAVKGCGEECVNETRCCKKHSDVHKTYYARSRKCKNPVGFGGCRKFAISGFLCCGPEHIANYEKVNVHFQSKA